jgi:hypothetical protein
MWKMLNCQSGGNLEGFWGRVFDHSDHRAAQSNNIRGVGLRGVPGDNIKPSSKPAAMDS